MKRNNTIYPLLILSLISLSYFGWLYTNHLSKYVQQNESLKYLQNNVTGKASINIQLLHKEDLNNKHIVIFTYTPKNSSTQLMGFSVFKRVSEKKLYYEKFSANNINPMSRIIETTNEKGEKEYYSIFYGIMASDQPKKFKIITPEGKTTVEEFKENEFFIKKYLIRDGRGIQVSPL